MSKVHGAHEWRKVNLVTRNDMKDLWQCHLCKRKKLTTLGPPPYQGCRSNAAAVKSDLIPLGCWSSTDPACHKCKKTMTLVPREGHVLSKLWSLESGDGMNLYACTGGCLE